MYRTQLSVLLMHVRNLKKEFAIEAVKLLALRISFKNLSEIPQTALAAGIILITSWMLENLCNFSCPFCC